MCTVKFKKLKLLLSIIILIFSQSLNGQFINVCEKSKNPENEQFVQIANAFIITNTNLDFLNKLTLADFRVAPNGEYDNKMRLFNVVDTIIDISYIIRTDYYKPFYYKDDNKTTCTIDIEISTSKKILNQPKFGSILKGFQRYQNLPEIKRSNIIDKSKTYSDIKNGRVKIAWIIYDLKTDEIYWRIEKKKGFSKVKQETMIIDAIKLNLVSKQGETYKRGLRQILYDISNGMY